MNRNAHIEAQDINSIPAEVGRRIRAYRKAECISQRRFAKMIGLDRTVLSNIERGKGNPRLKTLMKIADGLGVNMSLLFQGNPSSEDVQYEIVPFPEKR